MPRSSFTLDDQTPLTGPRIDVPARIGWLLRTTRGATGMTLREMASALHAQGVEISAASVSRIESEGRRAPELLDGYAVLAGMPEGTLRAAVDYTCRTFPYAPSAPPGPALTLDEVDRRYAALSAVHPSASEWWGFASTQVAGSGFGMPSAALAPLVIRMARDLQRTTGRSRWLRWEALNKLNNDRYASVMSRTLMPLILEPDSQRPDDLIAAVAERTTPDSLILLADLLQHESLVLARCASYALQSLLVMGGLSLEDWCTTAHQIKAAWVRFGEDPARRAFLEPLTTALPPQVRAQIGDLARTGPATAAPDWSRPSRNAHYAYAGEVSRAVSAASDLPEDPMLTRLLFEAFFDPRGVRMSVATLLVSHSRYRAQVARVLPLMWDAGPEPTDRAAVARVGAFCQEDEDLPDVSPLLACADSIDFCHGLTYHAHGGATLAPDIVERGLAADEPGVRRTLFCLGMAGDPRLETLALDPTRSDQVRRAARWWLAQGPRLTD